MKLPSEKTTLLLVGHGSRRPEANAGFEALVQAYQQRRADLDVQFGYIELAQPPLQEVLTRIGQSGCPHVVVLPLLFFRAGHVKQDIPRALARARRDFPGTTFTVAEPLGVHPLLSGILRDRAAEIGVPPKPPARAAGGIAAPDAGKIALLVVGRGSSDPDANSDFCKLVRLFREQSGVTWVLPCFIGITNPSLDEALELVARVQPEQLFVLPYYLFTGVLVSRICDKVARFAASRPGIRVEMAQTLAPDERLLDLLDLRIAAALRGEGLLPCDNCQYRSRREVYPG